jgi:phosphoglucosamine mutase
MREGGYNLGGEQSGHIVMTDYATTGDGLMAGLQFLAAMIASEERASTLLHRFDPVPQLLKNVRFAAGQAPLEHAGVQAAIADAELALAGRGRLLIRKSGTEPLVRGMAEHEDQAIMERAVDQVVEAVADALGDRAVTA